MYSTIVKEKEEYSLTTGWGTATNSYMISIKMNYFLQAQDALILIPFGVHGKQISIWIDKSTTSKKPRNYI